MPSTFAKTLLAEWREPSGFIVFHDESPDGLRRSASKVDSIGLSLPGYEFPDYSQLIHNRGADGDTALRF